MPQLLTRLHVLQEDLAQSRAKLYDLSVSQLSLLAELDRLNEELNDIDAEVATLST